MGTVGSVLLVALRSRDLGVSPAHSDRGRVRHAIGRGHRLRTPLFERKWHFRTDILAPAQWWSLGFFYLVLPNAAGWLTAHVVGVDRSLVAVDYLLIAAVVTLVPAAMTTAMLTGVAVIDLAMTIGPRFSFDDVTAVPALLEIGHLSALAIACSIAAVALIAIGAAFLVRATRRGPPLVVAAMLLTAVVVALDQTNGSNTLLRRSSSRTETNIATSFGMRLAFGMQTARRMVASAEAPRPVEAATDGLTAELNASRATVAARDSVIVLILVESMGRFTDGATDALIWSPFDDAVLARRNDLRRSTVSHVGGTVAAEVRELCGFEVPASVVTASLGRSCLPNRLAAMGYHTVAIHGHFLSLFTRDQTFPNLGFQRLLFRREASLALRNPQVCGTLVRGVCDLDMIPLLRREIEASRNRPTFILWITLSTHFPIARSAAEYSSLSCARLGALGSDESGCRLGRALHAVLAAVAELAKANAIPPTRFIIVGDHPPPFGPYIQPHMVPVTVPYIELIPRSGVARAAPRQGAPH